MSADIHTLYVNTVSVKLDPIMISFIFFYDFIFPLLFF